MKRFFLIMNTLINFTLFIFNKRISHNKIKSKELSRHMQLKEMGSIRRLFEASLYLYFCFRAPPEVEDPQVKTETTGPRASTDHQWVGLITSPLSLLPICKWCSIDAFISNSLSSAILFPVYISFQVNFVKVYAITSWSLAMLSE